MLNRRFGLGQLESSEPTDLDELLTFAPPVDGIHASILSMEAYDTSFGLHSHDDDHDPLSLVSMHPKENIIMHGKLQAMITAFRKHKVGSHMNMSFDEFMNYPRHITKLILKDCEDAERTDAKRAADILSSIDTPGKK